MVKDASAAKCRKSHCDLHTKARTAKVGITGIAYFDFKRTMNSDDGKRALR